MVSGQDPYDDEADVRQLLMAGAESLNLALSPQQTGAFAAYLALLSFWNRRLNLTAIRKPDLVVRLHFIDSLAVVPFVGPEGGILDVGSGAGFPGIPIKLMLPGKRVYLLEPRRKRANFLRQVARELKLEELHVIEGRTEDLSAETLPPMMETITRGFSDAREFLRTSGEVLEPSGTAVLMHGPKGSVVLKNLRAHLSGCGLAEGESHDFRLPPGGEQRTVLTFRKILCH